MKKLNTLMFTALLGCVSIGSAFAQTPRITVTVAGNGAAGFNGDGKPGCVSSINTPHDICRDAAGNIYFADQGNSRIRKVDAQTGLITTVAGGGSSTADGVPATDASISPAYICIDASGNLYFSSYGLVRKIDAATGMINTVAGNGTSAYLGDGGPAVAAEIEGGDGIAVDAAGNLYIADGGNNRVRKVTAATGIITTICGDGTATSSGDGGPAASAQIYNPALVTISAAGDLFVYESFSMKIRKINTTTGVITAFAGGGSGTLFGCLAPDAQLDGLSGMCGDGSGNIFCNEISCSCRKIDASNDSVYAIAGNYYIEGYSDGINSLNANMDNPYGLCADNAGNLYIADAGNNRIRKSILLTHTPTFAYGTRQTELACPATDHAVNTPLAITDLDAGQTETWSVVSAPVNGTLSGFPYTLTSTGPDALITPSGLSYTPATGFSGNDSFKVSVSDGTLSDLVTVYVLVSATTPDAGIISGAAHVCIGNTVDLSETAPDGVWTASNANALFSYGITTGTTNTIAGNTVGVDTIYYSVLGGCISQAMMVVTIDALPDAGYITGAYAVNVAASTPLSETVVGGVWSSSDITVATVDAFGNVTGVSAGGCYINYTVSEGACSAVASNYITVNAITTGVKNTSANVGQLSVMPNPTKDHFTVMVTAPNNEAVTINITNVTGQKVKELKGYTNQPIDASIDVAAGIYLLNATTAHGTLNGKVVVE